MTSRTKGTLLLLVAFVLGAAAGVLGYGVFRSRPDWHTPEGRARFQESILARMTKDLELRPDQQQAIGSILRESGDQFAKLREEMQPRFREIRTRTSDRIRGVLDAQQRAKFEEMVRKWEERANRGHGAGGPERKAP
ncbi:MAG TPA: hypothetical protein VMD08_18775 [Candidatus Baltobacteraceae bacterium]|nr:hypothetical protein [Candidatus Baltobacteraceae bacterium]